MSEASSTSFGELLRQHRLGAGLTQEALAECAGMSERSVRALEQGRNRPQKGTAQRLAEALALRGDDRSCFLSAATPAPRRRAPAEESHVNPHGLPAPPTTLLGREQEVAEVGALLARSDIRVLTLTGPGGVGKTRLALEVAWRVAEWLPGEHVFVPLASLRDPELVLSAVARALDLTEGANQPLPTRLIAALQGRHLLLVLDNLEHLLDAAPDLSSLRAACPDLRLLITSRVPLHVQGEQVYPVRPLQLPARYESGLLSLPALAVLSGTPAVRLFIERARSVKPGFSLTPANGWAVTEICRSLDGLPLAIELAAARVAVLSPPALLVQLAHPLRLLTGGARDLPARQRTLRTAIAWSHDLLERDEQALFRRLGVFAGGCELDAIEAIRSQDIGADALEGCMALTEASLLVAEEADKPRFRMLETIRDFALEQLESAGEGAEMRRRQAAFYLTLAERAAAEFEGPRAAETFRRLERELDNIRAVLAWAREAGEVNTALRLAAHLFIYWYGRGYREEGRAWLEGALALTSPDDHTPERAAALAAAGGLSNQLGDFQAARRQLEESAGIWRELGNRRELLRLLPHLSIAYSVLGEGEKAWAGGEETLTLAREDGDLFPLGLTLHGMGVGQAWEQHDFAAARALYEESRAAFETIGSTVGMTLVTNSLGDLARLQGEYAAAREHYQENLALAFELMSKSQEAIALHNLGHTAHCLGDEQEAGEHFRRSLRLFRDIGDTRGVAECLAGLACLEAGTCPTLTVRWFAAARAAVEAIGTELSASNEGQYASALERARAELGNSAFDAAMATTAISLEKAVKEALERVPS